MNFDLTEEQELLQNSVLRFFEGEMPRDRLRKIFEGDDGFDADLWRGFAELGVLATAVEEEYGGLGLGIVELALISEALGSSAAPGPFLGHVLCAYGISKAGSQEQKERLLPLLASGELIGTVAFGEMGNVWLPGEWKIGNSGLLNGEKTNVLYPNLADVILVGQQDGGLALVEKNATGMECNIIQGVDRTRRLGHISFKDTPCDVLPDGAKVSDQLVDAGLVLLSADAFGGAIRCLNMAVEYAQQREQFGVTIGHFQALKHQLATIAHEVEPSRGLFWYAALALDTQEEDAHRIAALAKSHITDRFMQASRDTVEAHGGIGYTWECDVQIWVKRAMFNRTYLGIPSTHRLRAADLAKW